MTTQGESGSTRWTDPDQARATVQQQIREAQERAERATQARAAIEAVSGRATTPQRDVTATVDASGRLVDLVFTEQALGRRPQDLSRAVLETVMAAQRAAGDAALEVAEQMYGEGSAPVATLREEYERIAVDRRGTITYEGE